MTEMPPLSSPPRPSARKSARSIRGAAVCVAMFALGGLVLWGLFLAPRGRSPTAPNVPWGAPVRPVRFASMDFAGNAGAGDALVEQIRKLDPDYVFVQNIRFDDVHLLAEALGMARSFYPQLFQRASPRSRDAPGDLILSKHPLYYAAPATAETGARKPRGVRAVTVFEGARFVVASGAGASEASRKQSGSPPTVLATGTVKRGGVEADYAGGLSPRVLDSAATTLAASVYADASWATIEGYAVPSPARNVPTILYAKLRAATTPPSDRD